jgi:hypothetical protein
MNRYTGEQEQSDAPESGSEALEKMSVTINPVGMTKNLEISDQMAGDKTHQNQAGDSHQKFAADGRGEKVAKQVHRKREETKGEGRSCETDQRNTNVNNHVSDVNDSTLPSTAY